jgi:arylformamidase
MVRHSSGDWIDLTLPLRPGMPVYPGDPPVAFLRQNTLATDGFEVSALRMGTHAGTHIDAPSHFHEAAGTVDTLSLGALVGPARVVDLTGRESEAEIRASLLGRVRTGERLLLRTDWSQRFGEAGYYTRFPSLALDAVHLLTEKRVALLGLETPSLCADHDADGAAHRDLLGAGVVIVESLAHLAALPERVLLIALPLPLAGLDGSPCRAIARRG